jgi:Spy/CpxP family protein refolding chaperone
MKKRYIFATTMLVVAIPALLLSGPVSAFKGGHCLEHGGHHVQYTKIVGMPFSGGMRGMIGMIDALDLTKEQQEKVWNIMDEKRTQRRTHMISMREGRKQIHEAVSQGSYDAAQIRKLADDQGAAMADLIVLHAHARAQIRSVLTPEQQAEFQTMHGQRRGGFVKH